MLKAFVFVADAGCATPAGSSICSMQGCCSNGGRAPGALGSSISGQSFWINVASMLLAGWFCAAFGTGFGRENQSDLSVYWRHHGWYPMAIMAS